MDYNRLIHDYVDGTLDSSKEEEMFMIISSNEELRAEFRHLLLIKQAVKGDVMAFTPSAQSTMNIFSALGFAQPPVAAPLPLPGQAGYFTRFIGLLQKYSQGIMGGLVAASLTAVVMIAIFNNSNNVNSNIAQSGNTINKINGKAIPKVESRSNDLAASDSHKNEQTRIKYIYRTRYIDRQIGSSAVNNDMAKASSINESGEAPVLLKLSDVRTGHNHMNNSKFPISDGFAGRSSFNDLLINNINPGNNHLGFTAELRGSQCWFLPGQSTINPEQFARFNNTAVSMLYHLTDNISIGGDVRQETFYQVFEGDSAGLRFRYSQQPNFLSYGSIFRYDIVQWKGFSPFGQVYLGGTNAGLIGRLMAGMTYNPYPDISFILGIEYSGLKYTHQGQGYNATKLGVNYGIGISF